MIITKAMDIPGETTELQHEWYQKIVNWFYYKPKILEIGCAWGRGSWAWLDCITDIDNGSLEILDNWAYSRNNNYDRIKIYDENYYNHIGQIFPDYNQKEILLYNLKQNRNFKKLKHIHTGKYLAAPKSYDIVYLDDDHSQENVLNELNYFNGVPVICGDDFAQSQPGVIQAICKFYSKNFNNYKLYTDPDARFWVMKRIDI